MTSSTISFIMPLADAGKNRKSGEKATTLASLMAAGYSCPRGFVLTSDAYSYHLWESGCHDPIRAAASSVSRNRTSSAIRRAELASDIVAALHTAYHRLALAAGEEHPEVVVRLSLVGAQQQHGGCVMGVRGVDAVISAIRELWAGMWDQQIPLAQPPQAGKTGGRTGDCPVWTVPCSSSFPRGPLPEAAVIVQQTAQAHLFGRVSTADESTGNPLAVRVTSGSEPMGKRPYGIQINLDGSGFESVSPESIDMAGELGTVPGGLSPVLLTDELRTVADKAILIENLLGGRVRIDWAIGPDGLWILDARRLHSLPAFFPGLDLTPPSSARGGQGNGPEGSGGSFVALTDQPVGVLSETLIVRSGTIRGPKGASDPKTSASTVVNGYVLRLSEPARDTDLRKINNELSQAAQLVEDWAKHVSVGVRTSVDALMDADLKAVSAGDLASLLARAVDACATVRWWSERVWSPCDRFLAMLPDALPTGTASDSEIKALSRGIAYPTVERDVALHQLGELFSAGEAAGKLDQPDWWRGYRGEVAGLVRKYGYAFVQACERHDLARWRSWVEDSEPVYRMIKALSHRTKRPSLVTRHSAAAQEAQDVMSRISGSPGGKHRAETEKLIWAAREWPARACECDMLQALALTSFRLASLEIGRRLTESGVVSEASEVFELPLDSLAEAAAGDCASTARIIADAKHQRWLNERFVPPQDRSDRACDDSLSGNGNGCGKVMGRVRIVRDMADAGELRPGDVLVVDSAESGWWPLLATAGALVSERRFPGDLSTFIGREYGVPCVVGCRGATTLIPSGRSAEVDSDAGTVEWGLR